ncbi:MAG: DUF4274 domain-containing protein [Pseudobutyrivibrio sp.]|nr:DUF4274 domain-containing protein [Pseudobutyrivibrio sp.]MCF0159134.1 DUF4274 domain-containing protein [Veillonella sp.]
MNKEQIKEHLYNDNVNEAIEFINSITDEESLGIYAYNYNWDNGFSVPSAILASSSCTMSIALLLFELADGFTYLQTKEADSDLPEWSVFIQSLYDRIKSYCFSKGETSYFPELSKVQLYKLKNSLDEDDHVFISAIDGIDCRIYL